MAKALGKITGVKEIIKDIEKREVDYLNQTMHIGSFFGGIERGKMLQIAIGEEHVQLNVPQVEQLKTILSTF